MFGPSEGVRSVMERPKPRRGVSPGGRWGWPWQATETSCEYQRAAREPGAEAQARTRRDLAAETERMEESARLSCPLPTEAVPPKGLRAEFQRAQTRIERAAKQTVRSLRAACITGRLIARKHG